MRTYPSNGSAAELCSAFVAEFDAVALFAALLYPWRFGAADGARHGCHCVAITGCVPNWVFD